MDTDRRSSRRGLILGIAVAVVFLSIVVGAVVWALGRGGTGSQDRAALRAPYESAMRKAGVEASFPAAPVELTSVIPSGNHPFSATFTAEEIGALLNTFSFATDLNGATVLVRRANLRFPVGGTIGLDARVELDGTAYATVVEAPVSVRNGSITSPEATRATAEGISLNAGQRAQLLDAVLAYANAYLRTAPGLDVVSAKLTPSGLAVNGTAPDHIEFR